MNFHGRWGWLTSRGFVRAFLAVVAVGALIVVLYNATAVDRVPPTVSIHLSNTVPGSGLAWTGTSIDVVFSENVKTETAKDALTITPPVAGSLSWQGNQKLIFTPSEKLPLGTTFHVHVKPGIQDESGNAQGSATDLTFTTVTAPIVKSISPSPNAKNVAVNSTIQITFDRNMDPDRVLAGLSISPPVVFEPTWNQQILTLAPQKALAFGTTYTVRVGDPAVDTDGLHLATTYQASFTTVGVGLRVSSVIPTNVAGVSVRTPIAVIFDGPIDPASVSGALQLTPPVSGDTRVVALTDDRSPIAQPSPSAAPPGNVLVFTPGQPLAPHTTYSVTLKPVVKTAGGEAAAGQTWSFTTGEPPTTAQNQIVFQSDRGGVNNVWLMNPDGSNSRQVTTELVPVSGFDVSADGSKIVYAAGGVVKRMSIGGGDLQTLTAANRFEYAPSFTPDATAVILGRRDASGADQGYWRVPIVSGADEKQVSPDGAPGLGSVTLSGDALTDSPGLPSWAPRSAFSLDGKQMLLVRGVDDAVVLADPTGGTPPRALGLVAQSAPVWVQRDAAFFLIGSADGGGSWDVWRVSKTGDTARLGSGLGALSVDGNGNMAVLQGESGSSHVAFASAPDSAAKALTSDTGLSDRSPSFSPDGSTIVFGRVEAQSTTTSAGIWIVKPDGNGLENLATDGAYPRWMP